MAEAPPWKAMVLCMALAVVPGVALPAASGDVAVPRTLDIPAGPFIPAPTAPSATPPTRLDEAAYGHGRTRQWNGTKSRRRAIRRRPPPTPSPSPRSPTASTAAFTAASRHPVPDVDAKTWSGYGLVHPFERTRRHAWSGGTVPAGRGRPSRRVGVARRRHGLRGVAVGGAPAGAGACPPRPSGKRRRAAPPAAAFPGAKHLTRDA